MPDRRCHSSNATTMPIHAARRAIEKGHEQTEPKDQAGRAGGTHWRAPDCEGKGGHQQDKGYPQETRIGCGPICWVAGMPE